MFRLAVRNVFRHRGRTAITLAAIVFGVAGLILSGGFVQDILLQLGEAVIHSQSGHIQMSRVGFRTEGSRKPERYVIESPEPLIAQIAALPMVADVMARTSFSALLNNGRADLAIVGEGIDPEKESHMHAVTISFDDANTITTSCKGIIDGKEMPEHPTTLKRVKS